MIQQHHNILLVEDSPTQAIRFKALLTAMGYQVLLASDGREGLCKAYAQHPALILLDFNLPSLSGLQLLSRLKRDRTTANIPIIMLSDNDHALQVEEALQLGAQDYLFKADYMQHNAQHHLYDAIEQVLHPSFVETA